MRFSCSETIKKKKKFVHASLRGRAAKFSFSKNRRDLKSNTKSRKMHYLAHVLIKKCLFQLYLAYCLMFLIKITIQTNFLTVYSLSRTIAACWTTIHFYVPLRSWQPSMTLQKKFRSSIPGPQA